MVGAKVHCEENKAFAGARRGKSTWLRRLVATATARDLRVIVVPGLDVLRAHGLDPEMASLRIAATPRHAHILLLAGSIPAELLAAAAVLYAQMMRPRAILALGCGDIAPLPTADLSGELTQQHFLEGVDQLRKTLTQRDFQSDPAGFNAPLLEAHVEYTCPMHPEVKQDVPGSCPKCGMTLVPHDRISAGDAMQHHRNPDDADSGHENMDHGGMDHGGMDHGGMDHGGMDHGGMDHGGMDHGGMDHGGMDHGEMGFMSMVEVTKDLPRSPDGLPMDWIKASFGPLFPGLPGGLLLTLTLDGDAVAKTQAKSLVGGAAPLSPSGMEAARFIEYLGAMDPLTPVAYRLLAKRALEAASGETPNEKIVAGRIVALEQERIASHLGWLAQLGCQIGFAWLERYAARMQLECLHADLPGIMRLQSALHALTGRLMRTPLLRSRLSGVGIVAPDPGLRGPVARAAGIRTDARMAEPGYSQLLFEMVTRYGSDAWDRLRIRLDEMQQSFAFIQSMHILKEPVSITIGDASGEGQGMVETPRGEACLHVILENGRVIQAHLDTPSTFHMRLLPDLLAGQELGDALTAACSLDLSPWEVAI